MANKAIVLTLSAALFLAGCGGANDEANGTDDRKTPPAAAPTPPPAPPRPIPPTGGEATPVHPQPGMVAVRPRSFERVERLDDRTLRVFFYQGVAPCSVLDRVDVEYGTQTVVVTLYVGHEPGAEDVACIEIAVLNYVDVELAEPLDGREVVDGAA